MKKIAAITMARNDIFFLQRWVNYYGKEFGYENLYVFLDGENQKIPENISKTNVFVCKHRKLSRAKGDKYRINLLSDFSKKLFTEKKYDLVIGTDADEFLVVDPNCKTDLKTYLSNLSIKNSVSALGVDVGQNINQESELNPSKSILEQRHFAVLSSRYTKASVIAKPVRWGSGFHRIKGRNFKIDKNLFLFHIGYCDLNILAEKQNEDRLKQGWKEHLKRRAKTIKKVTDLPAKKGDEYLTKARKVQTLFRPIFAWNKPTMLWKTIVIKIPDRFQKIFI